MATFDWPSFFLSHILIALPFLLLILVGIILSIAFWKRHPMVSMFGLFAFLIFLGSLIVGTAMQFHLMASRDPRSSLRDIERVILFMGIFRAALETVAGGLLLTALFGWRSAVVSDGKAA